MVFDYFKSVSAKGVECTQEIFLAAINEESLIPLYNQIAAETDSDKRQALKRQLPAITYQAHFPDGKRSNSTAIMSGLFMMDIDHIEDPYALYSNKVAGRTEELGIVIAHMTPSRKGLRIVAKCRPEFSTIAENQAWLAKELDVEHDEACKDAARLSYLVPQSYFYFLDNALWELPSPALEENNTENTEMVLNEHESHESHEYLSSKDSKGRESEGQNSCSKKVANSQEPTANSFLYRGMRLKDIAERYVSHFGAPVLGERHTYYYKMCAYFKYICDCDKAVLLAELPDFGLTMEERCRECDHACSKPTGASVPKPFYLFLKSLSLVAAPKVEITAEEMDDDDDIDDGHADWPKFPPIYRYARRVLPPHLVIPSVLALDSILGTYASNLVAKNLNGHPEHTAFHNLILGQPSKGKGEIQFLFEKLCAPLLAQDSAYSKLWQEFQLKKDRASNGKQEDLARPFMLFRMAPEKFSLSSILEYMDCAHGQLQLLFTTEIDALYKRGAHADFDDLYRKAFHQESASQRYLSAKSFNGIVKVLLSVLATGTPQQFWKHYGDPENGLTSRLHYHFMREEFIPRFVVKPFNSKEEAYIRSVLEFAQSLTNEVDEESGEIIGVKPEKDISPYMQPYVKACEMFWEKNRLLAIQTQDYARDEFSHREGVMLFRGGMIDWLCYKGHPTKEQLETSIRFRTWLCQMMLENKVQDFGERVNKNYQTERKATSNVNLYEMLGDTFEVTELQQKAIESNILSPAKRIIYLWKKQGIIVKCSRSTFKKVTK